MFKKGSGDALEIILAIVGLLAVYTILFFVVPALFSMARENFTIAQMNAGDAISLDSMINTELEINDERVLISELVSKSETDKQYNGVLEREIKKILDGMSFSFDDWETYDSLSGKVKKSIVGYAAAVYIGNEKIPILVRGENFNEDFCVDECASVASYELYENSRVRLYKSVEET